NVSANRSAAANKGELTVTIRGADTPRTKHIPFTIAKVDFRIAQAPPADIELQPGDTRQLALTIDRSLGYAGPIEISLADSPAIAMHGSYDGALKILAGSADGGIHCWYRPDPARHPNEFKWDWTLTEHKKAVTCLAYSPDGRQAVSGSADGTAALWDTHTRNQ